MKQKINYPIGTIIEGTSFTGSYVKLEVLGSERNFYKLKVLDYKITEGNKVQKIEPGAEFLECKSATHFISNKVTYPKHILEQYDTRKAFELGLTCGKRGLSQEDSDNIYNVIFK